MKKFNGYEWAINELKMLCDNDKGELNPIAHYIKDMITNIGEERFDESIPAIKTILTCIFNGMVLSSLKGTDDEWEEIKDNDGSIIFANKRYPYMYKDKDGNVSDIGRFILCNEGKEDMGINAPKEIVEILDKLYPIEFPYSPANKVYLITDGYKIGDVVRTVIKKNMYDKDFKPLYFEITKDLAFKQITEEEYYIKDDTANK